MPRRKRDAIPPRATVEHPWRVPIAQTAVPATGLHLDLTADEQVRARIARLAGLESLPRLSASFDLSPDGRCGLRVIGRVSATVEQTCGVTLEPLTNEIDTPINLVFRPDVTEFPADQTRTETVIPLDDVPEPLVNGIVDLGALATEFLILGIDPYPRNPGMVFEAPSDSGDAGHPFAALAGLTKGRGEGSG